MLFLHLSKDLREHFGHTWDISWVKLDTSGQEAILGVLMKGILSDHIAINDTQLHMHTSVLYAFEDPYQSMKQN